MTALHVCWSFYYDDYVSLSLAELASHKAFWLKVPNLGRGGFGAISVLFYRLERHGSLDLSFDRRATGTRRCSDRDGDSPQA